MSAPGGLDHILQLHHRPERCEYFALLVAVAEDDFENRHLALPERLHVLVGHVRVAVRDDHRLGVSALAYKRARSFGRAADDRGRHAVEVGSVRGPDPFALRERLQARLRDVIAEREHLLDVGLHVAEDAQYPGQVVVD